MKIFRRVGLALAVGACVVAGLVLGMGSAAHDRTARRAPVARLYQASNDAAARAALQRLLSRHPQTAQLVR
jgi:hypothetical protein